MKAAQQAIDRNDPNVRQFVEECGLAAHSTAIRLTAADKDDIELQINRLSRILGTLIIFNRPHQSGHGWIVYGTIIG